MDNSFVEDDYLFINDQKQVKEVDNNWLLLSKLSDLLQFLKSSNIKKKELLVNKNYNNDLILKCDKYFRKI